MTDLRKAAEMALEVLENPWKAKPDGVADAIIALRQALAMEKFSEVNQEIEEALAQPEQKPVAWMYLEPNNPFRTVHIDDYDYAQMRQDDEWFPVYTAPPKREWVGLTDEEGAEIWGDAHDLDWNRLVTPKEIIKRIEAKLKEKNGG